MVLLLKGLRAMLAGIYISIGCVAYVRSTDPIIGSLLFSIALVTINIFDLPLFTGRVYRIVAAPQDRIMHVFLNLVAMWFCNFAGCYLAALVLRPIRYYDRMVEACASISYHRIMDGPVGLFMLGLGCNMLIYVSSRSYRERHDTVGTIMIVLSTMMFIICGFEHSIAMAFIMIMGNTSITQRILVLTPITLGNGIGAVIPALIMDRFYQHIGG